MPINYWQFKHLIKFLQISRSYTFSNEIETNIVKNSQGNHLIPVSTVIL